MSVPKNAAYMKKQNKRLLLKLIRKSPISRADISRETGLTRAAVSVITESLIEEGLIIEKGTAKGGVGRNPIYLQINPNAFYAVGLNIARNNCSVGITSLDGEVISKEVFNILEAKSNDNALLQIKTKILNHIDKNHIDSEKILGLGITAPGPLNSQDGIILVPPNFNLFNNYPIVNKLNEYISCKILLENNSIALTMAEKNYGVCQEIYDYFLILADENGIGGGIVINDKIYKGSSGFGSEIGHTSINCNGEKCSCGNYGCLEMYSSIPTSLSKSDNLSWKKITEGAAINDVNCIKIIDNEAKYFSTAIVNAMNLLDLQTVVLTGALAENPSDIFMKKIEYNINQKLMYRDSRYVKVLCSALRENAEIISSANLILDSFFEQY